MQDTLLYTPGPVTIPTRIIRAMDLPALHHRTSTFSSILCETLKNLGKIFGTDRPILPIHATGRGAMEASFVNIFTPGTHVVSIANGRFGKMFGEIGAMAGLSVQEISTDWEHDLDLEELDRALSKDPEVKAVTVVQCETSMGTCNPIREIAEIARRHGCLVLVDAVSSLGGMEFLFDKWDVDLCLTASQKGLMAPTGLSFVVLGDRARALLDRPGACNGYFSFSNILKSLDAKMPETPGSTPVSLMAGVCEGTRMILEQGLDTLYSHRAAIASGIRSACSAMGCAICPPDAGTRSSTVSCIAPPLGVECADLEKRLKDRFGIEIAGGLGPYKKKFVRIGHMGSFDVRDALLLIPAIGVVLEELTSSKGIAEKGIGAMVASMGNSLTLR